jgi:hypothetical protein
MSETSYKKFTGVTSFPNYNIILTVLIPLFIAMKRGAKKLII